MAALRIEGTAYPSGSSRAIPAVVDGDTGGTFEMRDMDGVLLAASDRQALSIDPRLGSTARRIVFPDGALFETGDHAAVDTLTGRTGGDRLHWLEAFHPRLIAVVAAAILGIWILWRYGLDIMASAAVAVTPQVMVEQIDRGTLSTIDLTMASETALPEETQKRVQAIFEALVRELDQEKANKASFDLLFRSMPRIGPNAFAMPGGTVVMTDQFVEKFPDDDVLAGVLGHELGHVVEKHGLRQIYRSLSIYVLIAFLAGDTGPVLEDIVLEGNLLLSLDYSRKHETAADEFGIELAYDAGFDPSGLKTFFEYAMRNFGGQSEWLSSHPSSRSRIETINAVIARLEAGRQP